MADRVRVIFVDADSGAVFAETDVPPEKLPANFAAPTTMHLGTDAWSVVRAEPITAAEFTRTSKLRIEMRRVVMVDPKQILFSLPTVSDELPACEPADTPGALVLQEDDWRQLEFVAGACSKEVVSTIAQIARIHREHQKPSGAFDAMHVRTEIPEPLCGVALTLDILRASFAGARGPDAIGVSKRGRVCDGFGLRVSSGVRVYGVAPSGLVRVLGLVFPQPVNQPDLDATALADLMATHRLQLVDWCRADVVPADRDAVLTYLAGG